VLRQTLIALPAGASLIVLRGRVHLRADEDGWEGRTGDLLVIPPARHTLDAIEDSVAVLTVAK
jgi:quercetin dioxygenase-like cupin family protein